MLGPEHSLDSRHRSIEGGEGKGRGADEWDERGCMGTTKIGKAIRVYRRVHLYRFTGVA